MQNLETLKSRTEAARLAYEQAKANELAALTARSDLIRTKYGDAPWPIQNVIRRRGRPPGSKNKPTASAAPVADNGKPKKKFTVTVISAAQLASRQLQGRYLGLIRQVAASKRAPYQKLAKEKGREAAIRAMLRDRKAKTAKKRAPNKPAPAITSSLASESATN